MVSYAGEAAVSGVSLVNQFNTIFIYLFTALASGGAVVISQYIGRKKNDDAGESASQLLSFSAIFSILIAVMVLIGNEGMLRLMFGKVEDLSLIHISGGGYRNGTDRQAHRKSSGTHRGDGCHILLAILYRMQLQLHIHRQIYQYVWFFHLFE